jgi:hypothetical protein
MLTIERVRQLLLADPAITDEEVEKIRDGFHVLVEDIIFPSWLEKRNGNKQKGGNENIP